MGGSENSECPCRYAPAENIAVSGSPLACSFLAAGECLRQGSAFVLSNLDAQAGGYAIVSPECAPSLLACSGCKNRPCNSAGNSRHRPPWPDAVLRFRRFLRQPPFHLLHR